MTPDELSARIERLGISNNALANHCGVDRATVGRWRRGLLDIPQWLAYVLTVLEKSHSPKT